LERAIENESKQKRMKKKRKKVSENEQGKKLFA
jgi:hypothetical protein